MKNFSNQKHNKGFYYMYGKHAVLAALANSKRLVSNIFCTRDNYIEHKIVNNFKHEIVDNNFLNRLLGPGNNHQGIAAKVKEIFLNDIDELDLNEDQYKVAILDQITDPQNIGSIIRSAAAFDIKAIIMPYDNSPNECASLAKTASGTLELVKIVRVVNLKQTIDNLKKKNFWIIGLAGKAGEEVSKKLLSGKVAIVLGSEDKGMRRLTREACDHLVKIPIAKNVESLNVSNAAAIVFNLSYQS